MSIDSQIYRAVGVLLLGAIGCTPNPAPPSATAGAGAGSPPAVRPATASRPPLTVAKLQNAQYFVMADGPVTLKNGSAIDAKQRKFELGEVVAYGDVNQDGIKDAVVPLTITIDDRNFVYLATLINENGTPKNAATQFLGGDLTVTELTIKDGQIIAKMTQPGVTITRTYELKSFKSATPATPKATP